MQMPEEVNRILTDRVSSFLFCPTETAIKNLANEGFPFVTTNGTKQFIENVGDVMQDSAELFATKATKPENLKIDSGFILATIHRAENTDDTERLTNILSALVTLSETTPIVLPLHPRTKKIIANLNLSTDGLTIIDPVGYLEMIWLLQNTALVLTDSGGVQKEAYFFGKPCVTMRDQTEWVELIEVGANTLVGADREKIIEAVKQNMGRKIIDEKQLYGGGVAAKRIAEKLNKA